MDFNYTPPEDNKNPLAKFARNLNEEVINNKIDPVIGRDEEIKRLIEIISRKNKNNPVLIGEPGVGKTAIVEGLVQRIINNDVPNSLKNKTIYELPISALMSGATFQGQLEQRLSAVIKQVKESHGNIILFIDEIHHIVETGKNMGSSMDIGNMLKPSMARGEIKVIGATTLNEYRKFIEKDGALERRMQKIIVKEPTKQETLTIMRGLKERWETFHQIKIHDSALIAAVNMSDRYITDKYLPDKAIDLIDEAAAKVKIQMHSIPTDLEKINREIIHVETERAALLNETDQKSKDRLEVVEGELTKLKDQQKILQTDWNKKKETRQQQASLKLDIEATRMKIDRLQSEGEFEKASKLLYVTLPDLQKKLKNCEQNNDLETTTHGAVTSETIAEVISKITNIPLSKLLSGEKIRLLNLSENLAKKIKGQSEAIDLVSQAVLRARAGINDPNRPLGSFLFVGPTGVGKTELAKALAYELFDSERNMVRIDMSEYMDKFNVSKLIGAPPGYVGYEEAGVLTEAIRRQPYSVILLDEIEKAHPDVLNILLQVLDDGQLKDAQGRLVNFKNTIIIMTSNIGHNDVSAAHKEKVVDDIKKYLRPEFINRIDEIVIFNTLDTNDINDIIENLLNEFTTRLVKEDIFIKFDRTTINRIREEAFDINYGARPIKRYIQKHVENCIAQNILANNIKKNVEYIFLFDRKGDGKIKELIKN